MLPEERKKLIWRCRRGTRELDRMLVYFLEQHYDQSTSECQLVFMELLELPDPQLQLLLMNTDLNTLPSSSAATAKIIRLIREHCAD